MEVIRDIAQMQGTANSLRQQAKEIGFVPTMGYLHEGHLSLVRAARPENDVVVVSIFVNPTQFDRQEDLEKYPVDIDGDLAKLKAEGVDLVFAPARLKVYPPGYATAIEVGGLTERWEGTHRPGHFRGVTTVVTKLFNIVKPHRTYFGQKDYQQARIVRRMVQDLDMDIAVVVLPTVREPDGLAMSSRNVHLTPEERRQASTLYRALSWAADRVKSGEQDARSLEQGMQQMIREGTSASVDYVAVCDPESLEPLERVAGPAVALLAVRFSKARLIDNLLMNTH